MPAQREKKYDMAVRLYQSGLTIRELGQFYGVSSTAVWEALKRRGCQFRPKAHKDTSDEERVYHSKSAYVARAQYLLNRAIRRGIVTRLTHCESCLGANREIHAHHNNYDKPLEVVWLCCSCHARLHKKERNFHASQSPSS